MSVTTLSCRTPLIGRSELALLSSLLRSGHLSADEEKVIRALRDRQARSRGQLSGHNAAKSLSQNHVHVLLPAYNEEESLPTLLKRFCFLESKERITVWVVDDGSTDRTMAIVQQGIPGVDIRLISHRTNLGLGQAVQSGFSEILSVAGANDLVVVMDADDTHGLDSLSAMVDEIHEGGADVVAASRFVPGGDDSTAPAYRRLLSRGASRLFRRILPLEGIRDFTSGYRAYRVSLLQRAKLHWGERLIEERGFACMVELLLKLRHFDPTIVEHPLILRYDRKKGQSKLKLFRTLAQYLKLGLRDRLQPPPMRP